MPRPVVEFRAPDNVGGARRSVARWWMTALGLAGLTVVALGLYLWLRARPAEPESRWQLPAPSGSVAPSPRAISRYEEDLGGGVKLSMVAIPGGQFEMGSPKGEAGRYDAEGPQRSVTIAPFFIGQFEITQAQWRAVAGWPQVSRSLAAAPSRFKGDDLPVEGVSWDDAREFCARLSRRAGRAYRLPSEAEWEYAARARTKTATYAGAMEILGQNSAPVLDEIAWYGGNSGVDFERSDGVDSSGWPEKQYPHSRAGTRPVGRKAPNDWGLYDMLGNVWEWVEDDWHGSYAGAPADGRAWAEPTQGSSRVVRGGSWYNDARFVRAACRLRNEPHVRRVNLGFRCARVQD
jgi:formylglycine-generating enzyme required for sulfatase activity